jgi:aminoglycoside 6'-N-acetyltransferase-1b/aminoglycoside 6'-N-acetyltransferase-2
MNDQYETKSVPHLRESAVNSVSEDITFRPLAAGDMPQLHRWLNNPLVAKWYGLGVENVPFPTLEQIETNYLPRVRGEKPTYCYIMRLGEREFGYVQTYKVGSYPEYAAVIDVDREAWGIDIFIGEDDCRGRGLGTAALRLFVERLVFNRPGGETAVIAPNPENHRAIRSYEKAGFEHLKTVYVEMENDHEYVMIRRKS